jgi:N-acetylglucosamine-6-phosphate deacetylase
MRNLLLISCSLILLSFAGCSSDKDLLEIEGILYSTGKPVSIAIENGRILNIRQLSRIPEGVSHYIAPGLIDIQINGYMGIDFTNPDLTSGDLHTVTKALWEEGVTTFLPTVITNEHEHLKKCFTALSYALDDTILSMSIPGFHLEGPYISPVQGYRGAHLEKYIRLPDIGEFSEYQEAARGGIMLVAIAPEIEGSLPFIRECSESGVIITLAHHAGNAEEITRAVEEGASMSNHLGNGCANMINRHLNPIWPQLAEDRLAISIIADGFHLTREEIRSFYKVKGDMQTILISDALDLAGLPPGKYIRGEREVLLTPDVVKFPAEDVLAGAASPVTKCVGNMMRFTGCSLESAINMASRNPAREMGLNDIGEITRGNKANLILFTLDDLELNIIKTYVNGELVYQSPED